VLAAAPSTAEEIAERARLLGLAVRIVGRTGGDTIQTKGETALSLDQLRRAHAAWLPEYMAGKRNS
jgi:phosphoribosylformylglycinamidine synthase